MSREDFVAMSGKRFEEDINDSNKKEIMWTRCFLKNYESPNSIIYIELSEYATMKYFKDKGWQEKDLELCGNFSNLWVASAEDRGAERNELEVHYKNYIEGTGQSLEDFKKREDIAFIYKKDLE